MTIIAATLAVALIATLAAMLLIVRQLLRHHTHCSEQWAQERRELMNRIQAPDRIPVDTPEGVEFPEPEVDEMALVGQITYDDDYGQDED